MILDKVLKVLKIIFLFELLILVVIIGMKYITPAVYANIFRAHNSNAPESFIITVTSIGFVKEDGSQVEVWTGSEDVDLTTVSSLADVKTFAVDVPAGKYKQFAIHFKTVCKVKGSVTVNNVTYYTKASHSGFATGPAELEELRVLGQDQSIQAFTRDFNPPAEFGKGTSLSEVHVLVDFSNFLTYYDGNGVAPNGVTSAGMYLWNYLPVSITFGKPAKKEIYIYSTQGVAGNGQLTIVYDSNDEPITALARPLYLNDSGTSFNFYGWLWGGFGSTPREYLKKNADGTIWLKMYGAPTDSGGFGDITIASFTRDNAPCGYESTRMGSGTFTKTKIE